MITLAGDIAQHPMICFPHQLSPINHPTGARCDLHSDQRHLGGGRTAMSSGQVGQCGLLQQEGL